MTIKNTLDEQNATFWLDFGTLLGAIRVSDFLSHDCDMDLGAFASQSDLVSKAIRSNPMFVVSHNFTARYLLYRAVKLPLMHRWQRWPEIRRCAVP